MKKISIITLTLALTACNIGGQGSTGPQGAPGKSAYEIWLEQGNTGTEQDFLDSLVGGGKDNSGSESGQPTPESPSGDKDVPWTGDGRWERDYMAGINALTAEDYLKYLSDSGTYEVNGEIAKQEIGWGKHGSYNQYTAKYNDTLNGGTHTYVYKEKELELGNYGVLYTSYKHPMMPISKGLDGYFHNRGGAGVNVYTPETGAKFNGSTMAYLSYSSEYDPTFIQGDAFFVYDPKSPELGLEFDNYYSFKFVRNSDGSYSVDVSGKNLTGDDKFNLNTGHFANVNAAIDAGYLKKRDIEEAFGNYHATFGYGDGVHDNTTWGSSMDGAFGASKQ